MFVQFFKNDYFLPSNYRPISLLNTMEKVFERILFKYIFNYLNENRSLHSINQHFCLATPKLSVKCKGLIFKLTRAGINGKLLDCLFDYLSNRRQKVILPGGQSNAHYINVGVPQGSILGPLLFLVFINDIVEKIESGINLFADNTSLSLIIRDPNDAGRILQRHPEGINNRAETWLVKSNSSKSESLITRKNYQSTHSDLCMSNVNIENMQSNKHLGFHLSNDGSWDLHVKK